MKVITDKDVVAYIDKNLNRDFIVKQFQSTLLESLRILKEDPDRYVPPRIVQRSSNGDSDTTHLFMPCVAPNDVGFKVISGGPSNNEKGLGFQGCTVVLDEITGELKGIVNAKNLTAFRTALASSLALTKVIPLDSRILPQLSVFGVGPQAIWHIKLALGLYPYIEQVNIINRTLINAKNLAKELQKAYPSVKFNSLSYQEEKNVADIKLAVSQSSIVFGCSPTTQAVIKGDYINKDPQFPVFISLVGSYKPHMIELEGDFISQEFVQKGHKILVDSSAHALGEAGELIQTKCDHNTVIEVADALSDDIPRDSLVTDSNIALQKIVGLSIMDLTMAKLMVNDTRSGGFNIDDF